MKYLITGCAGFAARHFIELLNANDKDAEVYGLDRNEPVFYPESIPGVKFSFLKADLSDKNVFKKVLNSFVPDYILHLASASSVQYSWQHPVESFLNNNSIFLALLDAIRESNISCRILSTGSSDVYGTNANNFPLISEDAPLNPASPYAAAKAAQEMMAKIYTESFGLDIIQTRSFTHFGPYQKDNFVLAKFAKHLTLIKRGLQPPELLTGNIDIIRDMTDVRDMVKAYYQLFKYGKTGTVYNVCSGEGHSLRNVIDIMCSHLSIKVELKIDKALLRNGEILSIVGSNKKIMQDANWQTTISFEEAIADLLSYWSNI